ncbi:MAG: hypothetical protein ACTTJM_01810 [Bergeyella cardium]
MSNILLAILFYLLSCSNKKDFDFVVADYYQKCQKDTICIIDFGDIMWFEWDTMYYFSVGNSKEDIEKILGVSYNQWEDIGDRVIFLNRGKIVYQKDWFPKIDKPSEGSIFMTNLKMLKSNKSDAKFKIIKQNNLFYLQKIDK